MTFPDDGYDILKPGYHVKDPAAKGYVRRYYESYAYEPEIEIPFQSPQAAPGTRGRLIPDGQMSERYGGNYWEKRA